MSIIDKKNVLGKLFSPRSWWRMWKLSKEKTPKVHADTELELYSNLIEGGYLHYGYFDNIKVAANQLSMADIEQAQLAYADKIVAAVVDKASPVLDSGCGIGGLMESLLEKGYDVVGLTPDQIQQAKVQNTVSSAVVINAKFEDIDTVTYADSFGTLINSESFQYIDMNKGFENAGRILKSQGRWIIVDYFRLGDSHEKSGHLWQDFLASADKFGWSIKVQEDITPNVLPTLRYASFLLEKMLFPLAEYVFSKVKYKKPALNYLLEDSFGAMRLKMDSLAKTVSEEVFSEQKRYMFLVLEKS